MPLNLAALAPLAGIGQGLDAVLKRQIEQQRLQSYLDEQQALSGLPALAKAGAFNQPQQLPTTPAQPPQPLPSLDAGGGGGITATPLAPPPTPQQTAAAGPLNPLLGGIPGGGPLGIPGLPAIGGFGGGGQQAPAPALPQINVAQSGGGGGVSPFGPGAPLDQPLAPDFSRPTQTADMTGPDPGASVQSNVVSFGAPQRRPTGGGGIVQPAGGFGVPSGYEGRGAGTDDSDPIIGTGAGGRNNPGNMKTSSGGWMQFDSPQQGVAAISDWLVRHNAQGQTTIRQLIDDPQRGYAPSSDPGNRGKNLAEAAARIVGVSPDQPVDMNNPQVRQRMVQAILQQEGATTAGRAVNAAYTDMSRNLSPEQHGIGSRGAQMLLARMPALPQAVHAMDGSQLAGLIDKAYPGASDAVKGAVFLKVFPMLNAQAKEETVQAWDHWKGEMEQLGFIQKEEDIAEQRAETAAYRRDMLTKGGQIFQQDGRTFQIDPMGNPREIKLPGTGPLTKPSTTGTPSAQESLKLYEEKEAAHLRGDTAGEQEAQRKIDDWNRAQGKGISGRQSAVMAARQGILKQHPEWADGTHEDEIQDQLGEYKRLQSIDTGFGSGVLGRNVVSLNTVAGHLQEVRSTFEALNSGNIQKFNDVALRIARETGQPEPTDFAAAYSIMAGEVVRLFTTTGGTEGDRNHFRSLLDADFSQRQGRGALNIFDQMIDERFSALEQQYSSVGTPENQQRRRERFRNQIAGDQARALRQRVEAAHQKTQELTGGGGSYKPGDIINRGGKQYRVTGGDPNDPDVEEVK